MKKFKIGETLIRMKIFLEKMNLVNLLQNIIKTLSQVIFIYRHILIENKQKNMSIEELNRFKQMTEGKNERKGSDLPITQVNLQNQEIKPTGKKAKMIEAIKEKIDKKPPSRTPDELISGDLGIKEIMYFPRVYAYKIENMGKQKKRLKNKILNHNE